MIVISQINIASHMRSPPRVYIISICYYPVLSPCTAITHKHTHRMRIKFFSRERAEISRRPIAAGGGGSEGAALGPNGNMAQTDPLSPRIRDQLSAREQIKSTHHSRVQKQNQTRARERERDRNQCSAHALNYLQHHYCAT